MSFTSLTANSWATGNMQKLCVLGRLKDKNKPIPEKIPQTFPFPLLADGHKVPGELFHWECFQDSCKRSSSHSCPQLMGISYTLWEYIYAN